MANRFTKQQRITAVKLFYKCQENSAEASRQLAIQYDINPPQGRNIKAIVYKFEETGSVADATRSGRPKLATCDAMGDRIVAAINRSPQKSTRRLSSELDISQSSVMRLLHQRKLKPYIPRLVQKLHDGDQDRRVEFCEKMLGMIDEDNTFIDRIWWSDEATFKLNGHINRHNCVYWSADNPGLIIEKEVNLPGICVWAAISSNGLLGPYFFDGTVTSEKYLGMLREYLWPRIRQNYLFQQDGAPPHYGRNVRQWLNENLAERWIGRRGHIEWPPRSPDLSPPDFFLWGVMKDLVYSGNPQSLEDLRRSIEENFQLIDQELCQKVCRSVTQRLNQCIEYEGEQFEHHK